MKISFNQNLFSYSLISEKKLKNTDNSAKTSDFKKVSYQNFSDITFKMRPDMIFLLNQTDKLLCAYSRRPMISPYEIRSIYAKLAKKPNAQSAINLLQQYENYMHNTEAVVFDYFKTYPNKGKKNFKDLLEEIQPESLERLVQTQTEILNNTDDLIAKLGPKVSEYVTQLKNEAIEKANNGNFSKKEVLANLKSIEASSDDKNILKEIYKQWYLLPRSTNNFDAFVVKYAKRPHDNIAQRLLSTSVATIEHLTPVARGGADNLGNCLLVSKLYNNDRDILFLNEYDELTPNIDIMKNIQRYLDDFINEINKGSSGFSSKTWYPESIQKAVWEESNKTFMPELGAIKQTAEKQVNDNIKRHHNGYRKN